MSPERAPKQDNPPSSVMLQKRIVDAIDRMLLEAEINENLDTANIEQVNNYLVRRFEERGHRVFSEHQNELDALIRELRNVPYANSKEVAARFGIEIGRFLLARYTPSELEAKLRRENAVRENWIEVNEALSYEVSDDQIRLHVPMVFSKSGGIEMFRLFEQALHIIGKRLKNDTALKNVTSVIGYSWIVYEHPALVQKMGFSVSERDESNEEALASIDREEFLKRYGN